MYAILIIFKSNKEEILDSCILAIFCLLRVFEVNPVPNI